MNLSQNSFRTALALSTGLVSLPAMAQSDQELAAATRSTDNIIIVTATRRNESVQDVPINIAAISAADLEEQRAFNLREVSRLVPGVHFVDVGARNNPTIVFRGLSASPLGSNDGGDTGGTVGTYLGEIPLNVDLRLRDVQRVEFLLGPQGTLYGSGTLGGAVRYIPNRPELGVWEGEARADLYVMGSSDGVSSDTGLTVNVPISNFAAFRGSVDYLDDQGFIDYPYAVRTVGVSNPDDFADPSNFAPLQDVNDEQTLFVRAALRVQPADWLDVNFSYTRQDQETGGRQISNRVLTNFPVPLGRYDSALRVPEPNDRLTELYAIEAVLDLGFAELTSASGWSSEREVGNRDQTDLLIGLEYSYEAFPAFSAFTLEDSDLRVFTQEIRLVSQHDGRFQWIVGGFYNHERFDASSSEFTPGFDQFAVNEFGGVGLRPDSLEYLAVDVRDLEEKAVYGELSYQITDRWNVTVGGRWYDYSLDTASAVDLPLFNTVFLGDAPDAISLVFTPGGQNDDGFLFKVNTSFQVTDDVLIYGTVSEGYRIGNSNGVPACPTPLPATQIICALPDEVLFGPDQTLNFEAGVKSQFLNRTLTLNAAAFYIEWTDPQVNSATQNGLSPITINGSGARSIGFELLAAYQPDDHWSFRASYAYADAQLTDTTLNLISFITPPGFQSTVQYLDGQPGDRLPGSPRHQFSFFGSYEQPISPTLDLGISYGVTAQSDVIRTIGGRGNNFTLSGFAIHNGAVTLTAEHFSVQLYVDNIFNEFAEGGVRGSPERNQIVADINGDPVYARTFGTFVLPPRTFGLRVTAGF